MNEIHMRYWFQLKDCHKFQCVSNIWLCFTMLFGYATLCYVAKCFTWIGHALTNQWYNNCCRHTCTSWWRHQMGTFSALLVLWAGNSPVTGEFLWQRPVTRSFDVFFDLRLNKRLSKQSLGWWFKTPSCSLYVTVMLDIVVWSGDTVGWLML